MACRLFKLDKVTLNNKQVEIHVSGLDLLDKTPIIDIKPYIPYSDAIPSADAGFAQEQPIDTLDVSFTAQANGVLQSVVAEHPNFKSLVEQILAQDPRPAYKQKLPQSMAKDNEVDTLLFDDKIYGIRLYQFNIKWRLISASKVEVFDIH